MKEWTMTLDGRKLTAEEIETFHRAMVHYRSYVASKAPVSASEIETVRALIHEMTFGGAQ